MTSGAQLGAAAASAACHQTSRPGCISMGEPVRRTTRIFSTEGVLGAALSALAFIGMSCFMPRTPVSCVMMSLHKESLMRVTSESAENAPKTTECTAPMRAQASTATASSGIICM